MLLDRIQLTNFRSYTKASFVFSAQTTLIIGPNAIGKTNILEAIYALATGKSLRAMKEQELVRIGEEYGKVAARVSDTDLELMITTGIVGGQKAPTKKYFVNGISRRSIDFVGYVKAVLFWPQDLELVTDSPSLRRRYLDSVLVQVDREYRRNLLSYERGIRQRNRVLDALNEGKANRNQLVFWNQLVIKAGGYLTEKRAEYIDYVNQFQIPEVAYKIEYDKSVISESRLEQYKDEEVAAKVTLVGPHRDDIVFLKSQTNSTFVPLRSYGSRGEQRLAVLWLKLAEVSYITKQVQDRPMLLLDDIFSELDEDHRHLVIDLLSQQQTIITSAEDDIPAWLSHLGASDVEVIRLPYSS